MAITVLDHIDRTRKLKKADEHVQTVCGCNTSLGHAALWSVTPRSGARWSGMENDELLRLCDQAYASYAHVDMNQKLSAKDLAVMAWHFGRSANAINEQLYKLLGSREYFKRIEI